jgi:Glycosyltransferase family 87
LGIILLFILVLLESKTIGDLDIFVSASRDLFAHKNIYVERYHLYYHYYYDVSFALLISPFQLFSLYWANFIWLGINVLLTFRIWKILISYLPQDTFSKKNKRLFAWISCLMIFSVWQKNIHLAQMTIFILWLSLEGIFQIEKNKNFVGAALIALGISIKLMPLLLVPLLLYRGRFKSSAYVIGCLILLLFIPGIFIGFEYNNFLLEERWSKINPSNIEHVLDVSEVSFQSLSTFFSTLFVEGAGNEHSLDLNRNILNVSLDRLKLIIDISRGLLILLTLYFLRTLPFKIASSKLHGFYEMSYILLITPLLFPHQQHYAFFFSFPAIMYLTYYYIIRFNDRVNPLSKSRKISLIITASIIYFLLNSHFILGEFTPLYNHFKTLTYGIFLLILLLAIARPSKLSLAQ